MALTTRHGVVADLLSHAVFYPLGYGLYVGTVNCLQMGAPVLLLELAILILTLFGLQIVASSIGSVWWALPRAIALGTSTAAWYLLLVSLPAPGFGKVWPIEGGPGWFIAQVGGVIAVSVAAQAALRVHRFVDRYLGAPLPRPPPRRTRMWGYRQNR